MPHSIYDTHAHINYPEFVNDMDEVLERCRMQGVSKIIAIGTDLQSSQEVIDMAQKYDPVYAVPGWHPSDCLSAPDDIRDELRRLASFPKVVALGETGLDYYRLPSAQDAAKTPEDDAFYKWKQSQLFQQHIDVALETGLNLVIHQRSAFEDTVDMLRPAAHRIRGVFHCFVGTPEQQAEVQALGSLVSFTGIVTFKNAEDIRRTVLATPIDQLMLETDCPYLAPVPFRGKRCEPAHVFHVAESIARLKGVSLEKLGEITNQTAHQFFSGLE
jgi:TatD DNase family protein